MNERVKENLKRLENTTKEIMSKCETILSDIKDVEGIDDMYVIETGFHRVSSDAENAAFIVRVTEDLFDEGEV